MAFPADGQVRPPTSQVSYSQRVPPPSGSCSSVLRPKPSYRQRVTRPLASVWLSGVPKPVSSTITLWWPSALVVVTLRSVALFTPG